MDTIFEEPAAARSNSGRNTAIAVIAALILTGTVLGGYLYLQKKHQDAETQKQLAANPPVIAPPKPLVQVTQDEARIKGSSALVNGSVQNISDQSYSNVQVEFELTRRSDGGLETRQVPLVQSALSPGQVSPYSTTLSKEYRTLRVSRVVADGGKVELPFHAVVGSKRPLEGPPATKNIVVNRVTHPKGEEFINTADNPAKVQ